MLGRFPPTGGRGLMLIVEPLATVTEHCAEETLRRLGASEHVAALLGPCRPVLCAVDRFHPSQIPGGAPFRFTAHTPGIWDG